MIRAGFSSGGILGVSAINRTTDQVSAVAGASHNGRSGTDDRGYWLLIDPLREEVWSGPDCVAAADGGL